MPEPVFVPRGDQLATSLIRGLLARPGHAAAAQVSRSFFPPDLTLDLSVPVSADGRGRGRASSGTSAGMNPEDLELMIGQMAWTLRQDPP